MVWLVTYKHTLKICILLYCKFFDCFMIMYEKFTMQYKERKQVAGHAHARASGNAHRVPIGWYVATLFLCTTNYNYTSYAATHY